MWPVIPKIRKNFRPWPHCLGISRSAVAQPLVSRRRRDLPAGGRSAGGTRRRPRDLSPAAAGPQSGCRPAPIGPRATSIRLPLGPNRPRSTPIGCTRRQPAALDPSRAAPEPNGAPLGAKCGIYGASAALFTAPGRANALFRTRNCTSDVKSRITRLDRAGAIRRKGLALGWIGTAPDARSLRRRDPDLLPRHRRSDVKAPASPRTVRAGRRA
jgi:hypothetical protein